MRRKCTDLYGGNLPKYTAAMYQIVRRQFTKMYGGNCRGGRGGILTKYPGKLASPKPPQLDPCYYPLLIIISRFPVAICVVCVSFKFDVFASSVIETTEVTFKPISSVEQSDIEFMIPADNDTYINLNIQTTLRSRNIDKGVRNGFRCHGSHRGSE